MSENKMLGNKVREYLEEKGVETPISKPIEDPTEAKQLIENDFREIMELLGLNLSDDSLNKTPERVARMFVDEIFKGLDYSKFPNCSTFDNKMKYDEMILVKDAAVHSTCEHHFVVFEGLAQVAYIPHNKVLGLSKINRVVDFFSRRPQIQERLTEQIYFALNLILGTEDIAVVIEATHHCVRSRGIKDVNSKTVTSKMGGRFRNLELRNEFLNLIK